MNGNFKSIIAVVFIMCSAAFSDTAEATNANNRYPLITKPYAELPLGTIKAKGWLLETLERQRAGMTSQMDDLYPEVMGSRNGWLGGDGDQWERGPYWIDGLIPLSYILEDKALQQKAQKWVEWALQSQREDGFFGPSKNYEKELGLQRNNSEDWWPRMVVLKFLKQYYSATNDKRVIDFMSRYFQYQLKTLPTTPLGNWTFWAEYRACDNLQMVYWLYNITGDASLLELGKLLHKQSYDFMDMFTNRDDLTRINTIHCVNLAQGIKEPIIYYQQDPNKKYIDAVKKAFKDIRQFHGHAQGMYGGDEAIHGSNPTQGSELCSAAELMFSLEEMSQITGDIEFLDHLEKIAFNALPTQISDDFMTRQYFQQANQVKITKHIHNFDINHGETDLVFGLLTGYPCCTSNFHQAWPKFTQNLWYATADNGLAALNYSPSEVQTTVEGVGVKIVEDTYYPMDDKINFSFSITDKKTKEVKFPFHLRIPEWCKLAKVLVNGTLYKEYAGNSIAIVDRVWKTGDKVELQLPMNIKIETWHENSVSVARGPLVYALKIEEKWEERTFDDPKSIYGKTYFEVFPQSKWNYGLINFDYDKPEDVFEVIINKEKLKSNYPWNLENAPIEIRAKAKEIPSWKLYNDMAGPLTYSRMIYGPSTNSIPEETVTLIPYGCTTLRVSQFPVIKEQTN